MQIIPVPEALQDCRAEPEPPAVDPRPSNDEFGHWVADMRAAGADCRGTVMAVRVLMQQPGAKP